MGHAIQSHQVLYSGAGSMKEQLLSDAAMVCPAWMDFEISGFFLGVFCSLILWFLIWGMRGPAA